MSCYSIRSQIIWLGDLNYRVALSYDETRVFLEDNDWDSLLQKDQVGKRLFKFIIQINIYLKKAYNIIILCINWLYLYTKLVEVILILQDTYKLNCADFGLT